MLLLVVPVVVVSAVTASISGTTILATVPPMRIMLVNPINTFPATVLCVGVQPPARLFERHKKN